MQFARERFGNHASSSGMVIVYYMIGNFHTWCASKMLLSINVYRNMNCRIFTSSWWKACSQSRGLTIATPDQGRLRTHKHHHHRRQLKINLRRWWLIMLSDGDSGDVRNEFWRLKQWWQQRFGFFFVYECATLLLLLLLLHLRQLRTPLVS